MNRISNRLFVPLLALSIVGSVTGCDDEDGGDDDEMVAGTDGSGGGSGNDSNGNGSGNGSGNDSSDDDDEGGEVDNVGACNDLLDQLDCGGMDLGQFVDCSAYASLSCDLSDYLQCLEDEFVCNDGVFDASGWAGCVSLASCE